MRAPSNNPVTLEFGATASPYTQASPHKGVDFGYSENTLGYQDPYIYAPFSGRVTQVPNNGNDGNGTYMTDSNGRPHGMLHAERYLVPNGSFVNEGDRIAIIGQSGYAFGRHCHWAVKQNGQFINGLALITGGKGQGEQEEVVKFNEGDRRNVNVWLYGEDKLRFVGAVGMEYKDAIGAIFTSPEYYIDQLVNSGDLPTVTATVPGNADSYVNHPWKQLFYDYVAPNVQQGVATDAKNASILDKIKAALSGK